MSKDFYEFKKFDSDTLKRIKPLCVDDFRSFVSGFRSAEAHHDVEKLAAKANHWIEEWSNVCNENQSLRNQIDTLKKRLYEHDDHLKKKPAGSLAPNR